MAFVNLCYAVQSASDDSRLSVPSQMHPNVASVPIHKTLLENEIKLETRFFIARPLPCKVNERSGLRLDVVKLL